MKALRDLLRREIFMVISFYKKLVTDKERKVEAMNFLEALSTINLCKEFGMQDHNTDEEGGGLYKQKSVHKKKKTNIIKDYSSFLSYIFMIQYIIKKYVRLYSEKQDLELRCKELKGRQPQCSKISESTKILKEVADLREKIDQIQTEGLDVCKERLKEYIIYQFRTEQDLW